MKMDMPTHQMIQIKVGLKLSSGADSPAYPAAMTKHSKNTDINFIGISSAGEVRIARDQLLPIRLNRQYDDSSPTLTSTLMKRNERATARAAPMRKNPKGTGSSVRSPNPWAYAGQATKLPATAATGRMIFNFSILVFQPSLEARAVT